MLCGGRRAGTPACLGDDEERGRLRADGTATGVRHAWTFDDMFSTFATQGLASKEKGKFTREELAPLAEVNVTSLKEFDYFTQARANGKQAELNPPVDYYLVFDDGLLTLHFTLPFKTPVKAQSLDLEVYDGTYFVDFSFAEKEPVRLVGAPQACKLAIARPGETCAASKPGEAFFNNLDAVEQFRRAVRQQDRGEMPVTPLGVRRKSTLICCLRSARACCARCGRCAGAKPVRRAACARRTASPPPTASRAGCSPSRRNSIACSPARSAAPRPTAARSGC